MPAVRLVEDFQTGFCGGVELKSRNRKHPRYEDDVARLTVERKPSDVHRALGGAELKARLPFTVAVRSDFNVVRLGSDLVLFGDLRTAWENSSNCGLISFIH